jgi:hypothetical protein
MLFPSGDGEVPDEPKTNFILDIDGKGEPVQLVFRLFG